MVATGNRKLGFASEREPEKLLNHPREAAIPIQHGSENT
jgi:hypothetical protein